MYSISKTFRFEAGHRLVNGYVGKDTNIHGHNYVVIIELTREQLDQYSMVKDFGELATVKYWLDENFDHALLLNVEDVQVIDFCRQMNFKFYLFDNNPTSEIIAREIYEEIADGELGEFLSSVTVQETETSEATYFGDLV